MTLRVHPDEIVASSSSGLLGRHPSWERVRLGDVAGILNGFAFKSSFFSRSEGVPLLRIRDVGRTSTKVGFTGEYDARYVVESGAIVVGMDGDFRAARWAGPPALLNQRVCHIAVRNGRLYDEAFLFYLLPGYLEAIEQHTSSITVKHLSSNTLSQLPLPLPPLAEQWRIVAAIEEHVSRIDAAAASLRAAAARADAIVATAVAESLLGEWPVVRLGDVTVKQEYGSGAKASAAGDVAVLRMGNIRDGAIDLRELKYFAADHPDASRFLLAPGDLLFNRTNSPELVGKSAVFGGADMPTAFASYLIRVRLNEDCLPDWAALVINSPIGRAYIAQVRTQQVGQANVNGTKLAAMPVPLPPVDDQRRLLRLVRERKERVAQLRAVISMTLWRSESLRRAILDRAFRGDLVPQDPNDEPASVLLEQIAAERSASPPRPRSRAASARDAVSAELIPGRDKKHKTR